jgi:hypothetical protein
MSMLRKIATFGTAAVVALTLSAAPASAKQPPKGPFDYYAQLDCGSGVMEVGSGSDLWSTFVDLETGRKYKPIAWDVSGEGFVVKETRSEPKKHSVACSYDDGVASGTVTVKKA